jgi:hypothetical protein
MSITAISAVVPRRPTMLAGQVVAVAAHISPWVRLNVDLCDGAGTITLRFLGRTEIPGIVSGSRWRVEGTPWIEGHTLMLNPLCEFVVQCNVETQR